VACDGGFASGPGAGAAALRREASSSISRNTCSASIGRRRQAVGAAGADEDRVGLALQCASWVTAPG